MFTELRNDRHGNVALMFGFTALPLLIGVGMAVDYHRAHLAQNKLHHAVDAAALAAASADGVGDAERIALANKFFAANLIDGFAAASGSPVVTVTDGKVRVVVDGTIPTTVTKLIGTSNLSVHAETEVTLPTVMNGEIALVLDYSGSMSWNGKYQAMRDAAIKLVEDVGKKGQNPHVRFGLVPFSHHVYLSLPSEYVVNEAPGGTWTNCTHDRKHPYNLSDSTPIFGNTDTQWGLVDGIYTDCSNYQLRNLVVRPLTNDHQMVINQLKAMSPYSLTHIALGLEFGWALLSPTPPFTEGAAYGDPLTLKVVVLLTDGKQTQKAWGAGNSYQVANGESNLEKLCTAVKANGIVVVTVAYDVGDDDTEDRLKKCASGYQYYFNTEDEEANISSVFEKITGLLTQAIYISK